MSEDRTREDKSVGRLLRTADVYRDADAPAPAAGWREALLMDFDEAPQPAETSVVIAETAAPLRPRHLLMMAPMGVALFLLGWWLGRGGVSTEEFTAVPPSVWVGCAGAIAGLTLLWTGLPAIRLRRGR